MKKSTLLTFTLAIALAALYGWAQDAGDHPGPPEGGGQGPRPPGGPGRDFRPPISLIEQVLDADHDGIISEEEIANAAAALKKLDKNGDGKLTPEEFRPRRRGPGSPGGGPGGPGRFDRGGQDQGSPQGDGQDGPRRRPAGE